MLSFAAGCLVGCQTDTDDAGGQRADLAGDEHVAPDGFTEGDIDQLLARMTLEEKATILQGIGAPAGEHEVGYVAGVPRLGIPQQKLTDGPAGVRDGQPATAFPAPVAVAASFDAELAREVGAQMGLETKARGYQVLYSPMINIVRVPEGGRNFETFGEDPHLAGELGVAHIQGVQSQGIAAQVKHFAANNQERDRMSSTSDVDERTLREIYLPAFEASVKKGGAWSLMCAYNQVNGVWACENAGLLHSLLKVQWAFDGVVASDYPATHSTVASARAGLDQEFGGSTYFRGLADAVRSGQLPGSVLDDQARRVLRLMFRTGLLHGSSAAAPAVDPQAGATLARRAAARGAVLLKNDQGTLPLAAASLSSIAVIGPYGNQAYIGGGGSSRVTPYPAYVVSPLDGIKQHVGGGVTVNYVSGASTAARVPVPQSLRVDYFNNPTLSGTPVATGVDGRVDHDWGGNSPAGGVPSQNWSARWTGTIRPSTTGDYHFATHSDDGSRVYVGGALLIDNWGPHAPETVYGTVHLEAGQSYDVKIEYYQLAGGSNLTWSWMPPGQLDPGIQQAVDAAKAASVAVVVVGDEESEGGDRPGLSLYGNQNALVAAVAAANPKTVVVLNTGGPVTMPWASRVHSLLEAWYPGEQDGTALADVLFGDVEPSGRLPVTFPVAATDGPIRTPEQYPGVGQRYTYSEKLEVGYRWFDARAIAPLFPFGYGLSYTSFGYSNLAIGTPSADGTVTVDFDVTNTGARTGSDVPQVYVGFPRAAGEPPRRLGAFRKVTLAPGASSHVRVALDRRTFSIWDVATKSWVVPGGSYAMSVGASSRDLRLTGSLTVPPVQAPIGTITGIAGQCVDIAGANTANGTAVQVYACNGTGAQRWIVADDASLRGLGKCLDVTNGQLVSGTEIQLYDCNDTDAQTWRANAAGQIVNPPSGLCLDTRGGGSGNGTRLVLAACGSGPSIPSSQRWGMPN